MRETTSGLAVIWTSGERLPVHKHLQGARCPFWFIKIPAGELTNPHLSPSSGKKKRKRNQYIGLLSRSSARLAIAWRNKQDEGGSVRAPLSDFITLISHRVDLPPLIRGVGRHRGRPRGRHPGTFVWVAACAGFKSASVAVRRCQCKVFAWNWVGVHKKEMTFFAFIYD